MTQALHKPMVRRLDVVKVPFAVAACLAFAGACTLGPPPGSPAVEPPAPATFTPSAAASTERAQYVAHALTPTVPKGLEGRRLVGQGSGFYVTPNDVLTNSHVAGDCDVVTVGNASDAAEQIAQPVAKDRVADLALVRVDGPAEPARFESDPGSETGKNLAVIGFPEHGMVVRQAELLLVDTSQRDLAAATARYRFNGGVRRGNSGGPVLDDTGAVVGVVVQKIDTVAVYQRTGEVIDNIGIAIANATVMGFLHANNVTLQPAARSMPLTPDQLLAKAHGFVRQIGCWK
jgi:S1-C subfamily serine protease